MGPYCASPLVLPAMAVGRRVAVNLHRCGQKCEVIVFECRGFSNYRQLDVPRSDISQWILPIKACANG